MAPRWYAASLRSGVTENSTTSWKVLEQAVNNPPLAYVDLRDYDTDARGLKSSAAGLTQAYREAQTAGAAIFVPPGTWTLDGAVPPQSGVPLKGAGKNCSRLQLPQTNGTLNYSMIATAADVSGLSFEDIGFVGNASVQTTPASNGSTDGFAVCLTGGVDDVSWNRCAFTAWGVPGVSESGGGLVINPASNTKTVTNVDVTRCDFGVSWNVCGVFIGLASGAPAGGNLRVALSRFAGGGRQNCVYFAAGQAGSSDVFRNVQVIGNQFAITRECDTCIELNGCETFVVGLNTLDFAAPAGGVLLRRYIAAGSVTGNVIRDRSGARTYPLPATTGVAVIDFTAGQTQQAVTLSGNTVDSVQLHAFQIDQGSSLVSIGPNTIVGRTRTIPNGLYLADASNVTIGPQHYQNVTTPIRIETSGAGADCISIQGGMMNDCGANGAGLITSSALSVPVTNFKIRDIEVVTQKAGTTYLVNVNPTTSTGNLIAHNDGGTLTIVNPAVAGQYVLKPL